MTSGCGYAECTAMNFRSLLAWGFLGYASLNGLQAAVLSDPKDLGNIWFIGDSIAQGGSDQDFFNSPRTALYNRLTNAGYTFSYTGHTTNTVDGLPTTGSGINGNLYQYHSSISGAVIGQDFTNPVSHDVLPGITSHLQEWYTAADSRLTVAKPDIILLMIGTNDVPYNDMANAPARIAALINAIYALDGIGNPDLYLASIPMNPQTFYSNQYLTSTYTQKDQFVRDFNAALPGLVADFQSQGKNVHFVDQYAALLPYGDAIRNASDSIHVNSLGDDVIAQTWFNAITVPEPATWALIVVGTFASIFARRWRKV